MIAMGITFEQFSSLHQMSIGEMRRLLTDTTSAELPGNYIPTENPDLLLVWRDFRYGDSLDIEVARQLHDEGGLSTPGAFRLVTYLMAAEKYFQHLNEALPTDKANDFWVAALGNRKTWGDEPRGKWPVTGFGSKEYWSLAHFAGTFDVIYERVSMYLSGQRRDDSDADPARLFCVNVSAADRRLRKRADDLDIVIDGDTLRIK